MQSTCYIPWLKDSLQAFRVASRFNESGIPAGALIRRWDNAPHHPQIATFPHHLHEGAENNVLPHKAVDFFTVVRMIEIEVLGLL